MSRAGALLEPNESLIRSEGYSPIYYVENGIGALVVLLASPFVSAVALKVYQALFWPFEGIASLGGADRPVSPIPRMLSFLPQITLLAVILAGVWLVLQAQAVRYTLTDRRLVLQRRFFGRVALSAELSRVQDITTSQHLLGRLFGYGDVFIETAATAGLLHLRYVHDPVGWASSVRQAVRQPPTAFR
jgi:uncharacterized membrane protein YdbT with pleckstrin-like domain